MKNPPVGIAIAIVVLFSAPFFLLDWLSSDLSVAEGADVFLRFIGLVAVVLGAAWYLDQRKGS